MPKAGYHFNSETLSFDKIETTIRKRIRKAIQKFISSFSLAIVMLLLIFAFMDSPKEKALKRENEEILTQYHLLSNGIKMIPSFWHNLVCL